MPREEDQEPRAPLHDGAFLDRAADALFAARTVLVYGEVNTRLARTVTAQLVALAASGDAPIRMIVHSPGGHVEAGDTIHDLVRAIAPSVTMIGTGWVASAGALIYSAARREPLRPPEYEVPAPPTARPDGAKRRTSRSRPVRSCRCANGSNRIFARATEQDYEKIVRDTERNFWMTAKEACDYGLVHRIVEDWRRPPPR